MLLISGDIQTVLCKEEKESPLDLFLVAPRACGAHTIERRTIDEHAVCCQRQISDPGSKHSWLCMFNVEIKTMNICKVNTF